jgi:hypothetical protein
MILSRLPRRAPQLLAAVGWVDKPSILAAHAGFINPAYTGLRILPVKRAALLISN